MGALSGAILSLSISKGVPISLVGLGCFEMSHTFVTDLPIGKGVADQFGGLGCLEGFRHREIFN